MELIRSREVSQLGSQFSGFYVFGSEILNGANQTQGRYRHREDTYNISFEINGLHGVGFATELVDMMITISNDYFGTDSYGVTARAVTFGNIVSDQVQLYFQDSTATALNDVTLPLIPPDISKFQLRNFFLGAAGTASYGYDSGLHSRRNKNTHTC